MQNKINKNNQQQVSISINGEKYTGYKGETILETAQRHGFFIPTFCKDKHLKPISSCFICISEVKGSRTLQPACSTEIAEGMEITLDNSVIKDTRKTNLELLLSNHFADCYAPCKIECPANVDIQGYIALAKRNQMDEAIKLIKEQIPLPSVIGRVCPRPCESRCRRGLLDEPVAIDDIKRVIADKDLFSENPFIPDVKDNSDKKIAVIGAGPAGLSCSYYLRKEGHKVDVFERLPAPGGMLRYGIPSYRLPRNVIDREVQIIKDMGVSFHFSTELGKDFTLESLKEKGYDAIYIAIGAQLGFYMKIEGENLSNVLLAVDFLRDVELGVQSPVYGKVFIIGGGNTAIDAARTSLRMGAEKVTIVYRRTEHEMPANPEEIEEAKEEGIEILTLNNPVQFSGNEKLEKMTLIKMELGEPDSSGRRSPIPINGSEYEVEADFVIEAVSQKIDEKCVEKLDKNRNGTIITDQSKWTTSVKGVFAGGDCVSGPDIVVSALAHGRKAAYSINSYLMDPSFIEQENKLNFFIQKEDFTINDEELKKNLESVFENIKTSKRNHPEKINGNLRKKNFNEFNKGLSEDGFKEEIDRCLECGCQDVNECKLKDFSNLYNIEKGKFTGTYKNIKQDKSSFYIFKEPNKCINCGRCIEVCTYSIGVSVFGFYQRGFSTNVQPQWNIPLGNTECIACGNCIDSCPVGALTERQNKTAMGPFTETKTNGTCYQCSRGCEIRVQWKGNLPVKVSSDQTLCKNGKFEWFEEKGSAVLSDFRDFFTYSYQKFINDFDTALLSNNSGTIIAAHSLLPLSFFKSLKNKKNDISVYFPDLYDEMEKLDYLMNQGIKISGTKLPGILENKNFILLDKLADQKISLFFFTQFNRNNTIYLDKKNLGKKIFRGSVFYDLEKLDSKTTDNETECYLNLSSYSVNELEALLPILKKNNPVIIYSEIPNFQSLKSLLEKDYNQYRKEDYKRFDHLIHLENIFDTDEKMKKIQEFFGSSVTQHIKTPHYFLFEEKPDSLFE